LLTDKSLVAGRLSDHKAKMFSTISADSRIAKSSLFQVCNQFFVCQYPASTTCPVLKESLNRHNRYIFRELPARRWPSEGMEGTRTEGLSLTSQKRTALDLSTELKKQSLEIGVEFQF
jgi:hypothetical protein